MQGDVGVDDDAEHVLVPDGGVHHRETDHARGDVHRRGPGTGGGVRGDRVEAGRRLPARGAGGQVVEIVRSGRGRRGRAGEAGALIGGHDAGRDVVDAAGVPEGVDRASVARTIGRPRVGDVERLEDALLGLEVGAEGRVAEIIAVEEIGVIDGGAFVEAFLGQQGVVAVAELRPEVVLLALAGRVRRFGQRRDAVAGGERERFQSAGDDGVAVADLDLAHQARGGGLVVDGLDLALIHAVVIAVEVPGGPAHDASFEVLGIVLVEFRPRQAVDADRSDRIAGQRLGAGGVKAGDRGAADQGVGLDEEAVADRRFVDEAHAFRRLAGVLLLELIIGGSEQVRQVARGPLAHARVGGEQVLRRSDLVHQVGAVEIEVREARGGVEKGLAAVVGDRRGDVLLVGIEFEPAVGDVREFERSRKVQFESAAVGVGQGRERPRGHVVPQGPHRIGHGLAGDRAALTRRPEREPGRIEDLAHQQAVGSARGRVGVLDVGVAPGHEVGGEGGGQGRTVGGSDGLDRGTLRG